MADVEYKHDYRAVPQLARSAEMHMMLLDKTFAAKDFAISISPDAPPYGEGYIAGFRVDGSKYETINGFKRAVVHLVNDSDHAWYVERGTDRSTGISSTAPSPFGRGHHVLARTIDFLERS
jgi:hypothetical protein